MGSEKRGMGIEGNNIWMWMGGMIMKTCWVRRQPPKRESPGAYSDNTYWY